MPTALIIGHVAFEDAGSFGRVLAQRGWKIRTLQAGCDDLSALDPAAADLLLILGGPIGVYEDDLYPFLRDELALVERRLRAGRPTLGVCLGAQVMARALGARVYPGGRKEIGWSPLILTPAGTASCLRHIAAGQTPVLHWHGDTFDLPEAATLLASTTVYPHQAFSWGSAALGLQFHPEVETAGLERWLIGHACELAGTAGVTVSGLRADTLRWAAGLEPCGRALFSEWLDQVMS
ncbi:GMP synthase (glutamine-hydrolysing) [uncultured Gammaproteobacteria bacterium]